MVQLPTGKTDGINRERQHCEILCTNMHASKRAFRDVGNWAESRIIISKNITKIEACAVTFF